MATLIIVVTILIICLIIIGIQFYIKRIDVTFPPVVADCPDYWLNESKGDNLRDS